MAGAKGEREGQDEAPAGRGSRQGGRHSRGRPVLPSRRVPSTPTDSNLRTNQLPDVACRRPAGNPRLALGRTAGPGVAWPCGRGYFAGVKVNLLTWNLGGAKQPSPKQKTAIQPAQTKTSKQRKFANTVSLASEHCRRVVKESLIGFPQGPIVAAFQECGSLEKVDLKRLLGKGFHVFIKNRQAIVSNLPLEGCLNFERFISAIVRVGGRNIRVFCYHGFDNINYQKGLAVRGGMASELRWLIDKHCGSYEAIILGDFNAEPAEPEIDNRWCLAVASDLRALEKSHNRRRLAFRSIQPNGQGTLRYTPNGGASRWYYVDYIAATKQLSGRISCQTETKLLTTALLNRNGNATLSDHLPVTGVLHL